MEEICIEELLRPLVLGWFCTTSQAKERSSYGIIIQIDRPVQIISL